MPVYGPNSPGTIVNDTGIGSRAWSNLSNAAASDDSRADVPVILGEDSNYLKATNFGFTVGAGETIDGIVIEVERQAGATNVVKDLAMRAVKGGTIGSTDRSNSAYWPDGVDAYQSYGSSSDLWGETWADTDIEATTFGMALAVQETGGTNRSARVDHVRITVYTSAAGGAQGAARHHYVQQGWM